ncbi:MAG: Inner membrane protein YqaA [Alphaproteobacteria bacterium MarineAlpha5_Bin5]|nr:MAG: Inner membrane protein YqaA [Alphaproteobacteria bacterium MarineAlpha5_Bin4]PPR51089.1 MAG: Inner membrane protein YqaA [Alphaproteobacteria bacterium MarineAlpha5_Bin5]
MIYISLLAVCFMVATIVPFGSEMYFATLLSLNKYNNFLLLMAASTGNVLGSVFNWICGYYVNYFIKKSWFPIKQNKIQKGTELFNKYGKWSLLLSWVPFIGDPITFVAGTLRYPIIPFLILVSIGKVGRYLVIYFSIIWAIKIF